MIVLGIDPGLTRKNPTALAFLNDSGKLLSSETFAPARTKMPWIDFVWTLTGELSPIIAKHQVGNGIEFIAYELPHVATNPQASIKLAHVCGVIVGVAASFDIPVIGVQPSEAKKALTGKGNASKEEMIAAAQRQFGLSLPKDVADACGIALAGLAKYRKG